MLDLEEQIHRYAEAAGEAVVPTTPAGDARPRVRTGRRGVWFAAAAALVAVAVVGGVLATRDDGDRRITAGPAPAGETAVAPDPGTWAEIPDAPIAERASAVMGATDDELIVWGGQGWESLVDGAAYSFTEGTWRELAPSPLSARISPLSVWTGTELVIWGGCDASLESGCRVSHGDGAAYDPATDTWRMIPEFGAVGHAGSTDVVWTGDELVLVGVQTAPNAFLPSDVVSIDLETGDWRSLDSRPGFFTRQRPSIRAQWTGEEVLVVSIVDQAEVVIDRLDPVSGRWGDSVLTDILGLLAGRGAVAWTGERLIIQSHLADGVAFDPATAALTTLPMSGSVGFFPLTALGDGAVTAGDRWLPAGATRWERVAPMPAPFREFASTAAHDGRLYIWGGSTCGVAASCNGFVGVRDGLVWTPPD